MFAAYVYGFFLHAQHFLEKPKFTLYAAVEFFEKVLVADLLEDNADFFKMRQPLREVSLL